MKLEYEEFAPLFGSWATKFQPFIESEDMYKIYQQLKADSQKEIICPESHNVFRVFQKTNPDRIKCIFYLMDPYPRRYANKVMQATGVAMDCSNSPDGKLQPSLQTFYDGIAKDLGVKKVECNPKLDYLLEQGVLLLNTDLTVKLNKTASHEGLWAPFQKFFLEDVMRGTKAIPYVLSGKASHKMEKYINPLGNVIYKIDHPSYAARTSTDWNTGKVFTKINQYLTDNGKPIIFWDKKEWDEELPF